MTENLILEKYMKEDAFLFDNISKLICKDEKTNYDEVLTLCNNFEENVVLFKIVPSYYVMKTILCFKLNDYETAHKYINGSLKYLLYVAKNMKELNETEQKNFDEYKSNVINQYKILTQDRPEYLEIKKAILPDTIKFITTEDEKLIDKEISARILKRDK